MQANCILEEVFCAKLLDSTASPLDPTGVIKMPPVDSFEACLQAIGRFPEHDRAEVFGLHRNVNITYDINESTELFAAMQLLQPPTKSAERGTREQELKAYCQVPYSSRAPTLKTVLDMSFLPQEIESRLPPPFDVTAAAERYPVKFEESIPTVLVQELVRFNQLLGVLRRTLADVQRGIKGDAVMTGELDAIADSIYRGQVTLLSSPLGAVLNRPACVGAGCVDRRCLPLAETAWCVGHGSPPPPGLLRQLGR